MMKTQKIYNIIAISLVYFFLEITVYRGVQLIGMQEYWISIPFFLYIISKMIRAFGKKDIARGTVIEISNIIAFIMFIGLFAVTNYISLYGRNIVCFRLL